jgi:alpha-ketoglutarate-dependent taurine dioxygenase
LLAAAASARTTFGHIPAGPVPVRSAAGLSAAEAGEIVGRYTRHGFAVLQLAGGHVTPGTLLDLARALGLGSPFTPPLYTRGAAAHGDAGNGTAAVSRISAGRNAGTADAGHPSFGRNAGQALHCDGTLQEIGYIKASLLGCESPAALGGDTILFNAAAAYARLAGTDVAAALALAAPGVLRRQANVNGCADVNCGPAFTVRDGRLVCGYCVTQTDSWAVPPGVAAADLHRGTGFLLTASLPGGPYFARLTLAAGQVIAFDNTRVSHGRTPYRDSPAQCRCLYRTLHLRHPRVPAPAAARAAAGRTRG